MASSLVKKLLVKPGQRIALVNAPAGYAGALAPLPEKTELTDSLDGALDAIHLFVRDMAELDRSIAPVLRAVSSGTLLWIAYPKGGARAGTDLHRDILHGHMGAEHSWSGVTLVAIDDVWSAMRFRPAATVDA